MTCMCMCMWQVHVRVHVHMAVNDVRVHVAGARACAHLVRALPAACEQALHEGRVRDDADAALDAEGKDVDLRRAGCNGHVTAT